MSVHRPPRPALDMLVEWSPVYSSQAGFHSGLDIQSGTVRVMGAGVWHGVDAQRYYQQQRSIVAEARQRFGPLKVVFDVRDWIVENPQSAEQFQVWNAKLFKPEDRLAAIVKSSLCKPHPRTALSVGVCQSFISAEAAEMWLHAYSHDVAA